MESAASNNTEQRKMPKPNNIITIPYEWGTLDFYKWWCTFLRPFVNLTNRELEVMACFLKQRWELSKLTSDQAILDTMLMSPETRRKIIEECNITASHFHVILSNLKKNNVMNGNVINPRLIPNQRDDDKGIFQLLILFKEKSN